MAGVSIPELIPGPRKTVRKGRMALIDSPTAREVHFGRFAIIPVFSRPSGLTTQIARTHCPGIRIDATTSV